MYLYIEILLAFFFFFSAAFGFPLTSPNIGISKSSFEDGMSLPVLQNTSIYLEGSDTPYKKKLFRETSYPLVMSNLKTF